MNKEKIIVLGGSGHLGNTVVKKLCERGYLVKLLLLPKEDISVFEGFEIDVAYGDMLDKDFLIKEIEEGSIVIHMAGLVDIVSGHKDLLYKVNVDGTKNVVDVCMEKKVKKLVYTSSVHTIEPKKDCVLSEPVEFDEKKVRGDYAKSKTVITKYIFEQIKYGLNAVVVYPAGIIGPNDLKISNMGQLFLEFIDNKMFVKVKGGYNFIDVRDAADAVINSAFMGRIGEGYVLSGNMVSVDDLFKYANECLRRTKKTMTLAMWFVKIFAGIAELYYKIKKKKPLFTRYSMYTLTSNHNFDNSKAKKELNLSIRPAKTSIYDSIEWLIKNRKRPAKAVKSR